MSKLALLSVVSIWAAVAQAQPYDAWSRYREITINTTATGGGANVTDSIRNFPVLVRLTGQNEATGANILNEALTGGADVRFTDSTGNTALSYQIEEWSTALGVVWVKVPTIRGNAATKIRVYWGRANQTTLSNGAAVFDTASGFTGVWHLNEAEGAGPILDATVNALNGTRHASVRSVPGVSGGARYYNAAMLDPTPPTGTASYHVDSLEDNAKYRANGSNTRITISAWVNAQDGGQDISQGIFGQYRYAGSSGRSSYSLMHRSSGSFSVLNTTTGTGDGRRVYTNTDFPLKQWRHLVATIGTAADGNVIIYVDGVAQAVTGNSTQATYAVPTTTVSRPLIGALERSFNQHFIGYVDELRFANGSIRSASWVKLEYETQKAGATAVTLGATQSVLSRLLYYPTKVADYALNAPILANTPVIQGTLSGANPFAISPAGTLPQGLSFSTSTGVISGTPTATSASLQYIVTANLTGGGTGRDTLFIAVTAGTPPGAPTNVTAVAGNGQATVNWTAPLSSGTSSITTYTARAVQDTAKFCTWTTGALSCLVTGLTNGTSYTFVVRATSAVGSGAFSAASVTPVTPAGAPGAPTGVTAVQASGTSLVVTVSWTAPVSNGGLPIADYYAKSEPGGLICYSPGQVTSPSCQMTGLSAGIAYTFTVTAEHSAGVSPASAPSNSVTPTGILMPGLTIGVTNSSQPFTFSLTPEAIASTEAFTMAISDMYGRTVWTQTVHPKVDGTRELRWNGKSSTGRSVSAGVYMVRVATVSGGKTSGFIRKVEAK